MNSGTWMNLNQMENESYKQIVFIWGMKALPITLGHRFQN